MKKKKVIQKQIYDHKKSRRARRWKENKLAKMALNEAFMSNFDDSKCENSGKKRKFGGLSKSLKESDQFENSLDKRNKKRKSKIFKEANILATGGLRKRGKLGKNKFKSRARYKRRK
eukprot:snap_masked-scaffold_27-processed-gene-1.36-mRNA-1 protein AED:1.00 eAED:1.00 QI:0/-1/0/0/-1/1/1/0/116